LKTTQFKNTTSPTQIPAKEYRFVARFSRKQKMWDKYIATLLKTVITIDLLGHGETECLGYVSMEDNAEAVQAVLAVTH
jgi:hypothetical protein